MNTKKSFVLYNDLYKQFSLLPMEERGALITAIFEYAVNGQVFTDLTPMAQMAFSFIQDALDRDRAAYEATCRKNRENGKKGGRPKTATLAQKTEGLPIQSKKADNDNDNDIDNDIDIDIDNDIDTGIEKDCGAVPKESEQSPWFSEPEAPPAWPSEPVAPLPTLSEQEKTTLRKEGISEDYALPRLERARAFAAQRGRQVTAVLSEWWKKDRPHARERPFSFIQNTATSSVEKSYDVDDFFEAALARSYATSDAVD
jgi:hypothetical protein